MTKDAENEEFEPFAMLTDKGLGLTLPESVYSVVIIAPLALDISSPNPILVCFLFVYMGPHFVLAAINTIVQLGMVWWLKEIVDERVAAMEAGSEKCPVRYTVQLGGLFVFNVYVLADIMGSIDMMRWVYTFKRSKEKCLVIKKLTVKVEKGSGLGGMGDGEVTSGMTILHKWLCFVFVLVPKIGIACLLCHYGTGFVVTSTSIEDVLLNCLAVCFFIDVDELLYGAFVPGIMKKVIQEMPPMQGSGGSAVASLVFRPFLIAICLCAMIFAPMNRYCN